MNKQVALQRGKISEQLIERAIEVMRRANKPVSIDYIAFHLDIGWATARSLLQHMALKGLVEMIDTTKGLIFASPEWVENTLRKAGKEVKVKDVVEG
ncbi:MAG: hypothetical protein QXG25_00280 [Nitrososphaerota archaeon]